MSEKVIHQRLYVFLEKKKILHSNQYGFWNKYYTNIILRDTTEKIKKVLDNKLYGCDTVNRYILLNKINPYGTRGQANKRFGNFLTQKTQYTNIKECSSEKLKVTQGVPQGSVLGPLIFLLLMLALLCWQNQYPLYKQIS